MWSGPVEKAKVRLANTPGLSPDQQRDFAQMIYRAELENNRLGSRALEVVATSLQQEEALFLNEQSEIETGFQMLAEALVRPDSNTEELQVVYADLTSRAERVRERAEQFAVRVEQYDEHRASPGDYHETLMLKQVRIKPGSEREWFPTYPF